MHEMELISYRNSNSPPKPLMIHTSVSLPPVGSDSPIRWELESAADEARVQSQKLQPAERSLGRLSVPASPHQQETPTFGQSHVPASPFAAAAHAEEYPGSAAQRS